MAETTKRKLLPGGAVLLLISTVLLSDVTNASIRPYQTARTLLPTQPEQVHISFSAELGIVVTWNTRNTTGTSTVKYGTDPTNLGLTEKGITYPFVQGHNSQQIHRVVLRNLKPDKKYYYQCGDPSGGFSKTYSFHTVPSGQNWSPKFAVYGDFGLTNSQSLGVLSNKVQNDAYHAILHVGDMAYDMDTDEGAVGDAFMNQIEPVAAHLPYMTCPGNHEYKQNFSNYKARFNMPGSKEAMYYSFDIGPAHIISINTEYYYYLEFGIKQLWIQRNWLINDLKNANLPENRAERPWIILMGHRPMYCSNNDSDDCTHFNRDLMRVGYPLVHWYALEPLLFKYGVDLVIWAHEHSYERFWPLYNKKVLNGSLEEPYMNPKGPVHLITGSAGCEEKHDYFRKDVPAWSAFRSDEYGFTEMTVHNGTHLTLEQISVEQKPPKSIDEITIVKANHGPFNSQDLV